MEKWRGEMEWIKTVNEILRTLLNAVIGEFLPLTLSFLVIVVIVGVFYLAWLEVNDPSYRKKN